MAKEPPPVGIVLGTEFGNMRMLGGDRPAPIKFPITLPPTLTGKHGRAWRADLARNRPAALTAGRFRLRPHVPLIGLRA